MKLRIIITILAFLAIFATLIGGIFFYTSLHKTINKESNNRAETLVKNISGKINTYLNEHLVLVGFYSEKKAFQQVFQSKNPETIAEANLDLDRILSYIDDMEVCYLMDRDGNTIASTNRKTAGSFVGKNYSFRPYFRKAIKGESAIYLALGVTSRRRGIYYSHPIYGKDREVPLGVLVLKESIEHLSDEINRPYNGIMMLTSPENVVFLSNRENWLYHTLWKLSPEEIDKIAESRQFGAGPWEWTGAELDGENYITDKAGKEYHLHDGDIAAMPGWKIVYFHDHAQLIAKIGGRVLKQTSLLILLISILVGIAVFYLHRTANAEISLRKKSEEELRESDKFIKLILDNLPIGVAVNSVDPDVAFTYMNDNFPKNYRTTREKIADPDAFWSAVYEDPEFRDKIKKRVLDDCASGDPARMYWKDIPITRKGEEISFINARNIPVPDKQLMISTVWDITERKKIEEQLRQSQKMETVGQLAGGVAHDFNNILAAIINYGHILLMNTDNEKQKRNIQHILDSADRAANLTTNLLAFSRKQVLQLVPIKINELTRRVVKLISMLIGEHIDIKTVLNAKDPVIMADSSQIEQVLMNLATNARDAMPEGGILTIETKEIEIDDEYVKVHGYGEPGRYALISVTDTGKGMGEETRNKIFEPFFTTKEVGKGTGLGLSMSYGIIKQHKGFINVYSEEGKGTTIKIYLPVTEEEAEEPRPSVSEIKTTGTETVLLAEDDEKLREVTKQLLEASGYKVIEAVDGEDAVEKFNENKERIQMLVFDSVMPKKSGKKAYDEIRKGSPDIKALFLSGYTEETIVKNGVLEEGLNFILKPVGPNELLKKIREILNG